MSVTAKSKDIKKIIKLIKNKRRLLEGMDDFYSELDDLVVNLIGVEQRFKNCKIERHTDGRNFLIEPSYNFLNIKGTYASEFNYFMTEIVEHLYQIGFGPIDKMEKYKLDQITDYEHHIYPVISQSFLGLLEITENFEDNFFKKFDYYSKEFRELRLMVFLKDGEVCAKCQAKPEPGLSLTIDHIKPVSKFPELAMDIDNLQVLCWECNQRKSDKY